MSLVGLTVEKEKRKERKGLMGTSQGTRKCCGFKVTGLHSLCQVPLFPRESLCLYPSPTAALVRCPSVHGQYLPLINHVPRLSG